MNFSNQTGLLSSMNAEQIFRSSVQSGQANMFRDEFCSSVNSCYGVKNGLYSSGTRSAFTGIGAKNTHIPIIQYVPTTGTLLVLNFGEII